MTVTVVTSDLLDAISDLHAFRGRDPRTAEGGLMLHTADEWLGITATRDIGASVAASASVATSGPGWGAGRGFVLTRSMCDTLRAAYISVARRAAGRAPHELRLTLLASGALDVREEPGRFPGVVDVVLRPVFDPAAWPSSAVDDAITRSITRVPATVDVPDAWGRAVQAVAQRRRKPAITHSLTPGRVLASVGSTFTASIPTTHRKQA